MNFEGAKDIFEAYRMNRPNLFSDSKVIYKAVLTKELFRLILSKLSVDMRQDMFEDLTRQLVLRLIAPNIMPGTGPNGGGDGKVDIRTIPVSEEVASKWYVEDGGCPIGEKWAFAVSCKQDWKTKINEDIKSIAGLNDGYTRVYFCTNQSVSSKDKLTYKQKFQKERNIEVEILDEHWYVQSVFEGKMQEIAVEALNLSSEYKEKTVQVGPNDAKNIQKEKEVEQRISDYHPQPGLNTEYIELLLESAIISRSLERPRYVVDGKFNHALAECAKYGNVQLQYRITYAQGWTDFFWYKDTQSMHACYETLKTLLPERISVDNIEKLLNLQMNLRTAFITGIYDGVDIAAEYEYDKILYEQIKDEKSSCALYLRIYFLNVQLQEELQNDSSTMTDTLSELFEAIKESRFHVEIPFESYADIIEIEGQYIKNNPTFERIIEEITDILADRKKEVEAGKLSLNRAIRNTESCDYKSAIMHLSKCITAFQKEGCETELVKSYAFMGLAYFNLNKPYAARLFFVSALERLMRQFYTMGVLDHIIVTIVGKLCEIEILLGRLVMYLNWQEFLNVMSRHPALMSEKEATEIFHQYDALWACRFADAGSQNQEIELLPDILIRQGMEFSANVLWQTLGYKEKLDPTMVSFIGGESNWREKFLAQPLMKQLLMPLNISSGDKLCTSTNIRSCTFIVTGENTAQIQMMSEVLLGYLEMYLTMWDDDNAIVMATDRINITLQSNDNNDSTVELDPLHHAATIWYEKNDINCEHFADKLPIITTQIVEKEILMSNKKLDYDFIVKSLIQRAYICRRYIPNMQSIFGLSFKNRISDWSQEADVRYESKSEEIHKERFEATQSDMRIVPLINNALWDKAGWKGCGFIYDRQENIYYLALLFENIEYGNDIFEEWMKNEDKMPLKVMFVTKINKNNMSWYRTIVTLDPKRYMQMYPDMKERYVAIPSRRHTMTPSSSQNLEMFYKFYAQEKRCKLIPLKIENNRVVLDESFPPKGIDLFNIEFRDAWTIEESEFASCAIEKDDDPFIPEGMKEAPVINLLKKKRGE